jgi:predicted nucleic acid-binding protein
VGPGDARDSQVARIYLIDKSAWEQQSRSSEAAAEIQSLIENRQVATCGIVALERLYSARNLIDWDNLRTELATQYRWLPVTEEVVSRAIEVQGLLADRGKHRGVSLPDLIIAATAEAYGATVLHYDKDYDLIAEVTSQRTVWVVPRGSAG